MKKRILKLTIAVAVILGAVFGLVSCGGGATALPDAKSASGGVENTSISWSYDEDTKILTLTGAGAIPDSATAADVAWYEVSHSIKRVEMSEEITEIGDYAFYYCPQLEQINVPSSVSRVGKLAFAFCSSLKSIKLPDTVTKIGEGCFEACTALENIYVPASVDSIGSRTFAHCSSLKEAVVMAQVSELPEWTFMGCTSLESLVFSEAIRESVSVADNAFENAKTDFSGASFTADITGKVTLTVIYTYEDGSEAAPSNASSYNRGESYSVVSPTIDGFSASKLTVSGTITSDTSETVVYKSAGAETEAETDAPEQTEAAPEQETDGIGIGGIVAIVILGVVIVAIIVLAIVMMRSDKGRGTKNTPKKK